MLNRQLSKNYEVSVENVRRHLQRNKNVLIEGVHWFKKDGWKPAYYPEYTLWTEEGFKKFGNFIKNAKADKLLIALGVKSRQQTKIESEISEIIKNTFEGITRVETQYRVELEDYPDREISRNMLEDTTLDQIFDVLSLIRGEGPESYYDLIDASQRAFITLVKFYSVHRNTIADACTRRLQLNISEFRELVKKWLNSDSSGIKAVLKSHTPEHYHSEINRFFA